MWPIVPFLAVPPAQPLPMPPPPVVAVYDAVYDEPPPRWESIRPRSQATAVGVGAGVATALVSGVLAWSLVSSLDVKHEAERRGGLECTSLACF